MCGDLGSEKTAPGKTTRVPGQPRYPDECFHAHSSQIATKQGRSMTRGEKAHIFRDLAACMSVNRCLTGEALRDPRISCAHCSAQLLWSNECVAAAGYREDIAFGGVSRPTARAISVATWQILGVEAQGYVCPAAVLVKNFPPNPFRTGAANLTFGLVDPIERTHPAAA